MPRTTDLSSRIERIRRIVDPAFRLVDCAVQFEIWACRCGQSHAPPAGADRDVAKAYLAELAKVEHEPISTGRLLPGIYGGKFDRLERHLVGPAEIVHRIPIHEGQVEVLTFRDPKYLRYLCLGGPGAGKSRAALACATKEAVGRPCSTGAIIAPTGHGRFRLWQEYIDILSPLGLLDDIGVAKKQLTLVNGTRVFVLAAKSSGKQTGSPLQGYTLDWAIVDESQNVDPEAHTEIAARGRLAGKKYFILETATNAQVPAFRLRLEEAKKPDSNVRVIRFAGPTNPWCGPEWWERLRGDMSEREYRQYVLAEDVAPEHLVYPEFEYPVHCAPKPINGRDITEQTVAKRYDREGVRYIIAQDFGVLVNASIVLKVYGGRGGLEDRYWYAIGEITSYGTTADIHARMILERYAPEDVIVIADPHFNTKDSDKADYHLFEREGLRIVPAVNGKIKREHRISMMRSLLREKRFSIDYQGGRPACPKLAQSFMTLQRDDWGEAERDKKDRFDMTHWTAATGYGVFPWEKIRGTARVEFRRDGGRDPAGSG